MVTILFSDRGIPRSYREMHGFGSHTFKWVNAQGKACWVKYHFKTESGIANLTTEEAAAVVASDPDNVTRDLFEHIKEGGVAAWRAYVQIMPLEDADTYRYDPFDVTKVLAVPGLPAHADRAARPRSEPGELLRRDRARCVQPGEFRSRRRAITRLLQGRLFSYPDTQRHRLGPNHALIPMNAPRSKRLNNYQRDGLMRVDDNGGSAPNYSPSRRGGPVADLHAAEVRAPLTGATGRTEYSKANRADDFEQAGLLYRVMKEDERAQLVSRGWRRRWVSKSRMPEHAEAASCFPSHAKRRSIDGATCSTAELRPSTTQGDRTWACKLALVMRWVPTTFTSRSS
jgi:catalase